MKLERTIDLFLRDLRSQNRSGPQSSQSGHSPSSDLVLECALLQPQGRPVAKKQLLLQTQTPRPVEFNTSLTRAHARRVSVCHQLGENAFKRVPAGVLSPAGH